MAEVSGSTFQTALCPAGHRGARLLLPAARSLTAPACTPCPPRLSPFPASALRAFTCFRKFYFYTPPPPARPTLPPPSCPLFPVLASCGLEALAWNLWPRPAPPSLSEFPPGGSEQPAGSVPSVRASTTSPHLLRGLQHCRPRSCGQSAQDRLPGTLGQPHPFADLIQAGP